MMWKQQSSREEGVGREGAGRRPVSTLFTSLLGEGGAREDSLTLKLREVEAEAELREARAAIRELEAQVPDSILTPPVPLPLPLPLLS